MNFQNYLYTKISTKQRSLQSKKEVLLNLSEKTLSLRMCVTIRQKSEPIFMTAFLVFKKAHYSCGATFYLRKKRPSNRDRDNGKYFELF